MTAFAPGTRLGPYEILSFVGSGGMGTVYRAHDPRLQRTVAIKILRNEDSTSRQRLEREARAIAALNHPRICTVHDTGVQDGVDYLVMEYLDGTTLAERLSRGPLPFADAIRYASQIADALDAAHRIGVVHRDLKPANVMLGGDGVKLLDFGIATALNRSLDDDTVTAPLSDSRSMVGTFHYMAPEQLEQGAVDTGADIWAFGCVFYEMLTGERAFDGGSTSSVIAAVLTSEPRHLPRLAAELPPPASRIVRACLERARDKRWQSARDLARELRWIEAGDPESQSGLGKAPPRPRTSKWLLATAILGVFGVAAAIGFAARRQPVIQTAVRRAAILLPPDVVVSTTGGPYVSPDGRRIIVIGDRNGQSTLWVRDTAAETFEPIEGTAGATFPFWAPDSDQIGFFADRLLKKLSVTRNVVETICDAANPRGGAWSVDGTIVFNPVPHEGLWRVSAAGGAPTPLTKLAPGQRTHRFPAFLPDGRHFLFTVSQQVSAVSAVGIGSVLDGTFSTLLSDASDAMYASNRIWFVRNRSLLAQEFDLSALALRGSPVNVVRRVGFADVYSHADVSVGGDGTVAFMSNEASSRLAWFDRSGKVISTVNESAVLFAGRWFLSPDANRLAYLTNEAGGRVSLVVTDLRSGARTRLLTAPEIGQCMAWSHDGDRIAATSKEGDQVAVLSLSTESSQAQLVLRDRQALCPTTWTGDGSIVIMQRPPDSRASDLPTLLVAPLMPGTAPKPLQGIQFGAGGAFEISPDGKWAAYALTVGGRSEGNIQRFPADGRPIRFTTDQVFGPQWRADTGELFYEDDKFDIKAVRITATPGGISIGQPVMVVKRAIAPKGIVPYGLSPDGQRVLTAVQEAEQARSISVIFHTESLLATAR